MNLRKKSKLATPNYKWNDASANEMIGLVIE